MTWKEIINQEREKEYYKSLKNELDKRYGQSIVFPLKKDIFKAFSLTKFEDLKVVILGQDPYHSKGQAQGLAFSTPANIKNPPSMQNILREIQDDLKRPSFCKNGDLSLWAKEGVLLLNTILTVEEAKAKSHQNLGWEIFTNNIISFISNNCENIIFLLWGSPAISKKTLIDTSRHFILTAPHPSPLSAYRGFFSCKHFSKTNEILENLGKTSISW